MRAQKSAVPVAAGHDAHQKSTQMNSTPNLATTAPAVKLSLAEKLRAHREYYVGLDQIHAIYDAQTARAHNTADRTNGPGRPPKNEDGSRTYKMATKTAAPIAPQTDDGDCDLTRLIVKLLQSASRDYPNGYYSPQWAGPDSIMIRWESGFVSERVALVQLSQQRVLFLAATAPAHPNLVYAFEIIDFTILLVTGFLHPNCPGCGGCGRVFIEVAFPSSHHVGAMDCPDCGGKGAI